MADRVSRVSILLVGVALLAAFGAVSITVAGSESGSAESTAVDGSLVQDCAQPAPANVGDSEDGADAVGWVDGYWYDEPLDIDAGDGLTEDELAALSARTAARFEALRCLNFEELPPVEVFTREEFAAETAAAFDGVDDRSRRFDNAMLETLLLVGSDEDSVAVRERDRSVTVGGYYDFREDRIVVISDDPDALSIDEAVLAHELGHALQDQHFDLSRYSRNTTDLDKATLGLIEGDVQRIEHRYRERCDDGRWAEPCLVDDGDSSGDSGAADAPSSWGLYFLEFQPYSDGPSFVEHLYREGGWEAVDAAYDDPPRATLQTISPELYGDAELDRTLQSLAVEDRSADDWERVTLEDGSEYDVVGQAGLSSILIAPAYDDEATPIISPLDFLNVAGGTLHPTNPLDYDQPETDGWRGDRLSVYRDGDRTGTVWQLAWTDAGAAERFAGAYERLIVHRGGERVVDATGDGEMDTDAHTNTRIYEFGADSDFEMALQLTRDGDRLWIVTAPTAAELRDVHDLGVDVDSLLESASATGEDGDRDGVDTENDGRTQNRDENETAPETESKQPSSTDADETAGSDDDTDDTADSDPAADANADERTPGFGVVATVVALVACLAIIERRE